MLTSSQIESIDQKTSALIKQLTSAEKGQPKIPGIVFGLTDEKKTFVFNHDGVTDLEDKKPVTEDTMCALYSCTKAMVALAALKLWEEGKLGLHDPAAKYVPAIDNLGIVDPGTVDAETGEFIKPPRKPQTQVTVYHLMNHTSSMAYAFLNPETAALTFKKNPELEPFKGQKEFLGLHKTPLTAEPGKGFLYGWGSDWLGLVVEEITGKKLGDYLEEILFKPLGMKCTFNLKDTSNYMKPYTREGRPDLVLDTQIGLAHDPEVHMGGHGIFGTVESYLKLLRLWLNYGYSPDADLRILKEETVKMAFENHLPEGETILGKSPTANDDPDLFTLLGMAIASRENPHLHPKGSIYWCGYGNQYFWIDLERKIAGFWATHLFPLFDTESYFNGYCEVHKILKEVLKE